jgi:adenine/guanine phosphoribosyltransferase-like PRPP-binding protein
LDGDRRSRVAITDTVGREPWPCTCGSLVHSSRELASPLAELDQLVLICPTASNPRTARPKDPVVALDFHRPRSSQEKEPAGALVRRAKYGTALPTLARDRAIEILARRMAVVINGSRELSSATAIAGIPGSHMTNALALQIGRRLVAPASHVEQITLVPDGPGFSVGGPKSRRAGLVILVDDVYRTGETFVAGAEALRKAGFGEVVGLTATCSFTRVTPSCDQDEDEDRATDVSPPALDHSSV